MFLTINIPFAGHTDNGVKLFYYNNNMGPISWRVSLCSPGVFSYRVFRQPPQLAPRNFALINSSYLDKGCFYSPTRLLPLWGRQVSVLLQLFVSLFHNVCIKFAHVSVSKVFLFGYRIFFKLLHILSRFML